MCNARDGNSLAYVHATIAVKGSLYATIGNLLETDDGLIWLTFISTRVQVPSSLSRT